MFLLYMPATSVRNAIHLLAGPHCVNVSGYHVLKWQEQSRRVWVSLKSQGLITRPRRIIISGIALILSVSIITTNTILLAINVAVSFLLDSFCVGFDHSFLRD